MNIEDRIKQAAEGAVLKIVSEGSWIAPAYNNRFKLPSDFMQEVWQMVDKDKVKQEFKALLEKEMASRILNAMAAEISTDIKRLLGDKDRREALRDYARKNIKDIVGVEK